MLAYTACAGDCLTISAGVTEHSVTSGCLELHRNIPDVCEHCAANWRIRMLWELYQLGRIHRAESAANDALGTLRTTAHDVQDVQSSLASLQQQLDRLTLMTI